MTHNFSANTLSEKQVKLGFRIHLLAFFLVTPAIWLVWFLTDTTHPWPLWSTPAWAIGVLFHYLGAFVFRKKQPKTF